MATIQSVQGGAQPFTNDPSMSAWDVVLDDGAPCVIYRKSDSKPLEPGMEVEITGTTKNNSRKGKIASQGGSFGGGGQQRDDKMRSKEQCMRGEAVLAAASYLTRGGSAEQLFAAADVFYKYIAGVGPTVQADLGSNNPNPGSGITSPGLVAPTAAPEIEF